MTAIFAGASGGSGRGRGHDEKLENNFRRNFWRKPAKMKHKSILPEIFTNKKSRWLFDPIQEKLKPIPNSFKY